MTIEFVGGPGVGKSHLYHHLSQIIVSDSGVGAVVAAPPADGRPLLSVQVRKAADALRFGLRHPGTAVAVAREVRSSGQRRLRHGVTKYLNLLAELRRAQAGPAGRLSEQGVLQAIWSLGLRCRAPRSQALLRHCREWLPHTALLVTADRDEVQRRLERRENGRSRLDGAAPTEVDADLERGDLLMSELLSLWQGLDADHRVVEVSNGRGVTPAEALTPALALLRHRVRDQEWA